MEKVFTDDNFQSDVVESALPVLVDFWAPWCGPCQTMGPIIEELAKDLEGKAVVGKLNVDENGKTASEFGVMSIPTLIVFKNGKAVKQFVGVQSKDSLKTEILSV